MKVSICKLCKDDMDYHNKKGCMMNGCKCKNKGKTYEESLR